MARLCLTIWAGSTLACLAGCSGQEVEGRWVGPFPLEGARQCEILLKDSRQFTIDCDRDAIVGGGRYDWDGRTLRFRFQVLTYSGAVVRANPEYEFTVEGRGNTLRLDRNDRSIQWNRMFR